MSGVAWDSRSLIVSGKRLLLLSGELHYMRIPSLELIRDRLVKAKNCGLNCVATYIAWNYHEPSEGMWSREAEEKLRFFLEEAKRLGLYVIARIGPYICAEWDAGGFPGWVLARCHVRRFDDKVYMELCEKWYEKIMNVLRDYLYPKGPIILVQVENEYFWGEREYILALAELVKKKGCTVPIVTNENYACRGTWVMDTIDHYPDPWDMGGYEAKIEALKREQPDKPPIVMELEGGWFETRRGSLPTCRGSFPAEWTEALLKWGFACGLKGFNIYMFHGGTNPVWYTAKGIAVTYDYEAAVREWGELSDRYHKIKYVCSLVKSFQEILLEGREEKCEVVKGRVKCKYITSDKGGLLFILNMGRRVEECAVKAGGVTVETAVNPLSVKVLPIGVKIGTCELVSSTCEVPLLKASDNGVFIGLAMGNASEHLRVRASQFSVEGLDVHKENGIYNVEVRKGVFTSTVDGRRLVLYALPKRDFEKAWVVEWDAPLIVKGFKFLREVEVGNELLTLDGEAEDRIEILSPCALDFLMSLLRLNVKQYEKRLVLEIGEVPGAVITVKDVEEKAIPLEEAEPEFDDSEWRKIKGFLEEGGFNENDYYWYRFKVCLSEIPDDAVLVFPRVVDYGVLFVNGVCRGVVSSGFEVKAREVLKEGENTLSLLLSCHGRPNICVLRTLNGLAPVYVASEKPLHEFAAALFKPCERKSLEELEREEPSAPGEWREVVLGENVDARFHVPGGRIGAGIYQLQFTCENPSEKIVLDIEELHGEAWIYVNGILAYKGSGFEIYGYKHTRTIVDLANLLRKGVNRVIIYVEGYGKGWYGIKGRVLLRKAYATVDEFKVRKGLHTERKVCSKPRDWSKCIKEITAKVNTSASPFTKVALAVKLEKANCECLIYFNDQLIGRYVPGDTQKCFYIPDTSVRYGENLLRIRAYNHREEPIVQFVVKPLYVSQTARITIKKTGT